MNKVEEIDGAINRVAVSFSSFPLLIQRRSLFDSSFCVRERELSNALEAPRGGKKIEGETYLSAWRECPSRLSRKKEKEREKEKNEGEVLAFFLSHLFQLSVSFSSSSSSSFPLSLSLFSLLAFTRSTRNSASLFPFPFTSWGTSSLVIRAISYAASTSARARRGRGGGREERKPTKSTAKSRSAAAAAFEPPSIFLLASRPRFLPVFASFFSSSRHRSASALTRFSEMTR